MVDTSVLIAAAHPADPNHAAALALMSEAGPAVVPNEVLVETLGVVGSRAGRTAAAQLLQALRSTDGVELGHETDLAAAMGVKDAVPALSIVDAAGVAMAWRLGCDLDTFDRAQKAAWSRRGSRARKSKPHR